MINLKNVIMAKDFRLSSSFRYAASVIVLAPNRAALMTFDNFPQYLRFDLAFSETETNDFAWVVAPRHDKVEAWHHERRSRFTCG
jgi:hypothetical protein